MKKLILSVLLGLGISMAFAQAIPSGRTLFPLAYDFATDYVNSWKEATIQKFDPMEDEYIISGFCVNKNLIGFIKQYYTVTIKGDGDSFKVTVEDMETVNCNKAGEVPAGASVIANPKSTWGKVANLISQDLGKRISTWSDEEYEAKLNTAVTSIDVLSSIKNGTSDLYFKKFIKNNNIIGRNCQMTIKVSSVNESTKEGFDYTIHSFISKKLKFDEKFIVEVYSNNDKLLSVKEGKEYKVNGKITNVDEGLYHVPGLWLVIEE